jgi:peptidyl-prolyl cis-trans isomerase SurA
MTFRISLFAGACGLSLLAMPGSVPAQAPRYQSPLSTQTPAASPTMQFPVPPAITPGATVVEDVIVRVNDQIISRSDLERSQAQLQEEIQHNNVPPAEAAEEEKNLLRDMIDKQLMLSRAKELGLNADNDVIRQLDEIRKQYKLASMEELERAARAQGISFEDFKADIRDKILEQQVVREEVGRRLQMTQAQEQAYYDAHKQEFEQPEQVRLSEILIPTAADAKDAEVAQAQAKANDVEAKIKAGTKFDDLAKTYSGGPTASEGGDLGMFKRGALAKVLEDQTFGLKAGETTAPIRTRQGFVILKVTEHQGAGVPTLKEIEPQIQEALYTEQLQPALRTYLTHLREDAYVDIKAGFVDTGASPKQTKPVFTATAPPPEKKKKQVEKQRFDRGGRFSTAASSKSGTSAGSATAAPTEVAKTAAAGSATTAEATTPTAPTGAATTGTSAGTASAVPAATAKTATAANSKSSKSKQVKKEKVRFGQAPRNSLPSSPTDTAMDAGLGRPDAEGPGGAAAPGAAMAPTESTTTFSASSDPDPLAPKPVVTGKTRYSAKAKTIAATKAANVSVKAKEKAIATPTAATAEEKATEATQAAPLGLNGDTAKKKKKQKVKGAPKERMQQTPKEPAAPAPEATPYRTPKPDSTTPAGAAPAPAGGTTPAPAPPASN